MLKIVAHVVAHEWQHGERVAAHHALLTGGSGGGFRAHGGRHVNAFGPVARLCDQRHGGRAAAAKNERVNFHAGRIIPGAVERRVVGRSDGETCVRVGRFGTGFFGNLWCPVFALPVDQVIWPMAGVFFHAFPPDIAVVGQTHVGEDDVFVQTGHAIRVGVKVGAGSDAEITGFRVDGAQIAIGTWLDPCDVVADGGDFPAVKTGGRYQHGEIGFATCAGKSRCDMVFFALRIGQPEDQHVLGQPALVAAHVGGDAQCKTFFAQQSIAAIARTVRPDFTGPRVMHDVFGAVARPGHVFLPRCQRRAYRMNAGDEIAICTEHIKHGAAHAGHDALIHRHVSAVAQLDADVRDRRTQRAHAERHHIHGAAFHAAVKQGLQGAAHFARLHPVVGRTGVFFFLSANVSTVFHPGHVAGVRAGQE